VESIENRERVPELGGTIVLHICWRRATLDQRMSRRFEKSTSGIMAAVPEIGHSSQYAATVLTMQRDVNQMVSQEEPRSDAIAALLSAIVDSSHDAIVSKTLDGIITSWNRAAEKMFGYSAAEAVGQSITLIIPPERRAEEDYVLGSIRRGQMVDSFETIRQTKDGRLLNISLTVSPVRDSHGRIIGASKIARDITDQVQMERERDELLRREQEARQSLAEAVAARDEFIAVAAHELRNPLNVFVLNLQLLQRVAGNPDRFAQVRGMIDQAREQLGRISTLVDRLLDVSRVRAGTFELYREHFDLSGLVTEIATRFKSQHPSATISLEINSSVEGEWDRTRLDQVLSNLISNALKYGKRKPIAVGIDVLNDEAVVRVRDEGIGMAAGDLDRIFERFERAAGQMGYEGLGLGLWITKQIVQAHGGTILATSEPGKGSTFVLHLPVHA
jgi:PAS domain S-box-containing protein